MRLIHSSILVTLATISISSVSASSAKASTMFEDGCEKYAHKDFERAARCFSMTIRRNKRYWPAYYQLANTYLALKEYDLAKKYYEGCIELMPDFKTAKACKLGLDHIESIERAINSLGDIEPTQDPLLAAAQKRKDAQMEEVKKQYEKDLEVSEKRKSDILQEAMKQAATIRAAAQQRIQELHDTGNYWVQNPSTGEIGIGIPKVIYDEITNEAEERAKRVIDQAEARARGIQKPREPDWESFKVHPSSVVRRNIRHH